MEGNHAVCKAGKHGTECIRHLLWMYVVRLREQRRYYCQIRRRADKIRYIGASAMYAWQFVKLNAIAKVHDWARFVSMQDMYNLIYREEEKEMILLVVD